MDTGSVMAMTTLEAVDEDKRATITMKSLRRENLFAVTPDVASTSVMTVFFG